MKNLLIFCLIFIKAFACTDFLLKDQSNHYVVGRSMEFGVDLKSQIVVAPKGGQKISKFEGKSGMQWTQKYAFIGLNVLDTDLIADGMNEAGLSFGVLWLPITEYPSTKGKNADQTIALQDVGAWILGSFSTVEQVKQALQKVAIFPNKVEGLGEVPPIHLSLHDRSGKSLVVEFIKGEMQISDNLIGVLTNAPEFSWHVTNLDNYINLRALNVGPVKFEGSVLNPTGQGSGMLGIPGDWTPPSRFVRIAAFKNFVTKAKDAKGNANLAFHLLNTVDIPYGGIQEKGGKGFDYTQWIVVKDLEGGNLYYRTYDNLNIGLVNLKEALQKGTQKIPMK